jgi:hypothetical protein
MYFAAMGCYKSIVYTSAMMTGVEVLVIFMLVVIQLMLELRRSAA